MIHGIMAIGGLYVLIGATTVINIAGQLISHIL